MIYEHLKKIGHIFMIEKFEVRALKAANINLIFNTINFVSVHI